MINDWLRRQRIAVVGGTGAVGRVLSRKLLELGAPRVVIVSRTAARAADLPNSADIVHRAADILQATEIEEALQDCNVVFHVAGLGHSDNSIKDPRRYFEVNALGTVSVLDACRRIGIQKVVFASTGHVYGIPQRLPVDESHPTRPCSVYASTKLAGEVAVEAFGMAYSVNCVIGRLANIYGGTMEPSTVIGKALDQVSKGQPIHLANDSSIRDFLFVEDAAEGLIRLSAIEESGVHVVNISTGSGESVREMSRTLARVAKEMGLPEPEIVPSFPVRADPMPSLILANERLFQLTGWRPRTGLDAGLRRSINNLFPAHARTH